MPDTYLCEICEPRPMDRDGAKALQMRKRSELNIDTSETDSSDEIPDQSKAGNESGKKGMIVGLKKIAPLRYVVILCLLFLIMVENSPSSVLGRKRSTSGSTRKGAPPKAEKEPKKMGKKTLP